jgi:copper homeostasis protein
MDRLLIEVIVQTVADARAATHGGADRLEVVRDIRDGGLTPPLSLVRAIKDETPLPLRIMVRENAGYGMNPDELPRLRAAAGEFEELGVDGIVIGFSEHGQLALDDVRRVLEVVPKVRVTFHRAFDQLRDPVAAIDDVMRVAQIDRILTDGGGGDARSRCRRLTEYRAKAGARVEFSRAAAWTMKYSRTWRKPVAYERFTSVGSLAKGTIPKGPSQPIGYGGCETSLADRSRRSSSLTITPTTTTATAPTTLCQRKATRVNDAAQATETMPATRPTNAPLPVARGNAIARMKTPRIDP